MNAERTEKRREFIINTLYFVIVAGLVFLCLRYLTKWLMPFIIGFALAFLSRPLVKATSKVTHLNSKISGLIVLILEYALILLGAWFLGAKIFTSLRNLFLDLPDHYDQTILPLFTNIVAWIDSVEANLSPDILDSIYAIIESATENIRNWVISLSSSAVSSIAGITAKIPFYFISFVFTVLATIFISKDYDTIVGFIKKQLDEKTQIVVSDTKRHIARTVLGYIRAFTIIWIITFAELAIGLSILRVENAIGIAVLIAFADVLPVVGTGFILNPWAIIALIGGDWALAIGLFVLYLIIITVRNFAEPKIVGDQLGLNPIVTILSIYLGYRLLGLIGMILVPVTVNILVGLHRSGKLTLWKD